MQEQFTIVLHVIFGFNSDVKHGDSAYHVQSEVRQCERVLQTQVFVGGRCIGRCELPFSDKLAPPGSAEEYLHEMLKVQHRQVIDTIREGRIESLFVPAELQLEWTGAAPQPDQESLLFSFRVCIKDTPLQGAYVAGRLDEADHETVFAQGVSDLNGIAELSLPLAIATIPGATLSVQVSHAGRCSRSAFRLTRKENCTSMM